MITPKHFEHFENFKMFGKFKKIKKKHKLALIPETVRERAKRMKFRDHNVLSMFKTVFNILCTGTKTG